MCVCVCVCVRGGKLNLHNIKPIIPDGNYFDAVYGFFSTVVIDLCQIH